MPCKTNESVSLNEFICNSCGSKVAVTKAGKIVCIKSDGYKVYLLTVAQLISVLTVEQKLNCLQEQK